jgi:hypothetical protein
MSVLGQYGGSALKYWGSILASAHANLSTADMWAAIRTQQAEYGLDKPGASAPDVSVIRGFANRIVNGAKALNTGSASDSITADMMGVAPYTASTAQDLATTPSYYVTYTNTVQAADGTIKTQYGTSVFTATQLPSTIGELQASIDLHGAETVAQAAQQTGGESGGTSLGTSNLSITVV